MNIMKIMNKIYIEDVDKDLILKIRIVLEN